MANSYGVDTSVLIRLITGEPPETYASCVQALQTLARQGTRVFASNQVIGEAFVTARIHYGMSIDDAKAGLLDVFQSELIVPSNGETVLAALRTQGGPGLMDRLIVDGYLRTGLVTLTLDRRMATLGGAQLV